MKYRISFLLLAIIISISTASANQLILNQTTGTQMGNSSFNATDIVTNTITSLINNITNSAGTIIASYVDYYSCDGSYCIYKPWYASGQIYAKNMSTGKIDYSGTVAHTVINSAISNNPSRTYKSKIVIFGEYSLSGNINPNTNTTIDILQAKLTLADSANTDIIRNTTGLDNFDLIGGVIDVNGKGQISNGRGIHLQNASNINIVNTKIYNSRIQSVFIAQEGYNNKIIVDGVQALNGSSYSGNAANNEIFLGGNWITIRNTISDGGWDGGIVIAGAPVNGNASSAPNEILVDNVKVNNTEVGIYVSNNGQKVTVSNCFVNNTKTTYGYGIRIYNTTRGTTAPNLVTIDNCILDNIAGIGIYATNNASNLKIRGGYINVVGTGATHVGIDAYGYGANNLEIEGVTINQTGAHNILFEGYKDSKIHDNFLNSANQGGVGGSGIRGINITNLSAYDNTILNDGGGMQRPIFVTGSVSSGNKAYNNHVVSGTQGGISGLNATYQNYGDVGYNWGISNLAPSNIGVNDEYTNSTSDMKCYKINSTTIVNLQNWTSVGC